MIIRHQLTMRLTTVALAVAVAFSAAGCGDDSDDRVDSTGAADAVADTSVSGQDSREDRGDGSTSDEGLAAGDRGGGGSTAYGKGGNAGSSKRHGRSSGGDPAGGGGGGGGSADSDDLSRSASAVGGGNSGAGNSGGGNSGAGNSGGGDSGGLSTGGGAGSSTGGGNSGASKPGAGSADRGGDAAESPGGSGSRGSGGSTTPPREPSVTNRAPLGGSGGLLPPDQRIYFHRDLQTSQLTVRNESSQPTTIPAITIEKDPADEFDLGGGSCAAGTVLEPQSSCTVLVTYESKDARPSNAVLSVGGEQARLVASGAGG